MYFWNYRQLSRDLRNNTISDKQYRIYLIIFWPYILWGLWNSAEDFLSSSLSSMSFDHVLVILFYPIWLGTTYRINILGDGKDYFKRLVCNKLPVAIIVFVLTMLIVFLKYVIVSFSIPDWTLLKEMEVMTNEQNKYSLQWYSCLATLGLYMDAFSICSGLKKRAIKESTE